MERREALELLLAAGTSGLAGACTQRPGAAPGAAATHRPASEPRLPNPSRSTTAMKQPAIYLPHGGGPCFFMEWDMGPRDTWARMASYLRGLAGSLPAPPRALLVVSAHWEEAALAVTTAARHALFYDYYGFPPHTYQLQWPAAGDPALASRISSLLRGAGFPTRDDPSRGLDHGVFIPMKLSFPDADVPTVQLSLRTGLDPAEHLRIGRALAPLRDEGVLLVGSGMSYHNMRGFMASASRPHAEAFDTWLGETASLPQASRDARLTAWREAPSARACHPREEHLLPLMVMAGAAGDDLGAQEYRDEVMGVRVSAIRFG